jgi:arylamine N-acetyltransferase
VQTLTAQRLGTEERLTLRNRQLVTDRGGTVSSRTLQDRAEVIAVLSESFGLDFPPDTNFRFNDA